MVMRVVVVVVVEVVVETIGGEGNEGRAVPRASSCEGVRPPKDRPLDLRREREGSTLVH